MIYVYAISSRFQNYIYVGQTNHVIRRFHEHNGKQERTTKFYAPFDLIMSIECADRSSARELEKYYKSGKGKRELKKLRNW